jgi:hypothetical protein
MLAASPREGMVSSVVSGATTLLHKLDINMLALLMLMALVLSLIAFSVFEEHKRRHAEFMLLINSCIARPSGDR